MLFDRFVFVLFLLFCYNWFLLGCLYDSSVKYTPIIIMVLSLCIVCVITMLQLQIIVKQKKLKLNEKWATIVWSLVHIVICLLILSDGMEIANILVIGMISGLLMTTVIVVVGTCSCYVIMLNGLEWYSHLHLTCICFWVVVQFMSIRLPAKDLSHTTTVPIVAMSILRLVEYIPHGCSWSFVIESCLWVVCIILHVVCYAGGMSKISFFWGTTVTVMGLIIFNRYFYAALLMVSLPFITIPLLLYFIIQCKRGSTFKNTFLEICILYEKWTAVPIPELLPLEVNVENETDWDERL